MKRNLYGCSHCSFRTNVDTFRTCPFCAHRMKERAPPWWVFAAIGVIAAVLAVWGLI